MWLLGRRELPEGITFHSGLDWICLHRDVVEYAVTGTDPLLTGLKEMYKYTMSPVEVRFIISYLEEETQHDFDVYTCT